MTSELGNHQKAIIILFFAALAAQINAITGYILHFKANGYLPAPFLYNKADTFMDLYNALFWGEYLKYTVWQSVYPPLNFLVLDGVRLLFTCLTGSQSPFDMRDACLAPAYILIALHLAAPFITVRTFLWSHFTRFQQYLIALAAATSAPFLFSMERGNLIIIAVLVLPATFSNSVLAKIIATALLINLKPYLALVLVAYAIVGSWRLMFQSLAVSAALFVFSGLLSDGNFPNLLPNLLGFSQNEAVVSGREVIAFPSSVAALEYVIRVGLNVSQSADIPINLILTLSGLLTIARFGSLLFLIIAMTLARGRLHEREAVASMVAVAINMAIWAGGYSQMFYLACVPVFWMMAFRWVNVGLVVLIFSPLDQLIVYEEHIGPIFSFLSDDIKSVTWQVGFGSIARPIFGLCLIASLGYEFMSRYIVYSRCMKSSARTIP